MPSSSWLLKLPFDTSGRFRGRDEGTLGAVLFSFFWQACSLSSRALTPTRKWI